MVETTTPERPISENVPSDVGDSSFSLGIIDHDDGREVRGAVLEDSDILQFIAVQGKAFSVPPSALTQ